MTSNPMSSQEYLAQMRAQRLTGQDAPQPTPAVQAPPAAPAFGQAPVAPQPEVSATPAPDYQTPYQPTPTTQPEVPAPANPAADVPPDQTETEPETYYDEETGLITELPRPIPERTLLAWTAPNRPFKKRNRQYYLTIGIIVILISLILFFAGQLLPIAVVISVAFLAYVLASVPPQDVEYQITNFGPKVEKELYYWDELGRFWFSTKYGHTLLNIEVARFPFRLSMILVDKTPEELREWLSQALIEQKPAETFFEQAANWLQTKLPLESE